jgi:hypothetical protein
MFAKLARIPAIRFQRVVAQRPAAARHANDNLKIPAVAATARRAAREILVCHWRPTGPGRRLECRWSLERAEETGGEGAELTVSRLNAPARRHGQTRTADARLRRADENRCHVFVCPRLPPALRPR